MSKRITTIERWYEIDLPSTNRFGYDIGNFKGKKLEVMGSQIDGMREDLSLIETHIGTGNHYSVG